MAPVLGLTLTLFAVVRCGTTVAALSNLAFNFSREIYKYKTKTKIKKEEEFQETLVFVKIYSIFIASQQHPGNKGGCDLFL